ncbi:MAG: hypothetical protein QOD60_505 [Solirubrobacterales bacterium]|jgi:uncharacterized membrane protein HdeD (DUF308 family)|nr:hypothetical protein [Solirubrobacterales bacterium]
MAAKGAAVQAVNPAHWWALILIGLFQVIAGILALVYTNVTLLALGLVFGINLLLAGTMLVVISSADNDAPGGITTVRLIVGFLTILGGLICIVRPGASVLVLLLVVAFWFVISGIGWLTEAMHAKNNRVINTILGLVGIAAGVILVGNPDIGLNTLANLAGILLIVRGSVEFAGGWVIRAAS